MKRPILVVLGLGFVTCLGLGLLIWKSQASTDGLSETWMVVSVTDGDTLTIGVQGEYRDIKLCGIEAPALTQPYGDEAKEYLEQLLTDAEDWVQVVQAGQNSAGTALAEVFTVREQETSMQEELLIKGLAAIASEELEQCPNTYPLRAAQEIAQENQVGLWSDID